MADPRRPAGQAAHHGGPFGHQQPADARAFLESVHDAIHDGVNDLRQRYGRTPQKGSNRARALHQDQIVRAALEIADAHGIDAVSMRRVASRLGVGAMSLYSHVADKQALIELMVDTVFGEERPAPVTGDWRADATRFAHFMREVLTRHPWLPMLGGARPLLTPALYRNLMDHMEYSLSIYDGLGLDIREVAAFDMLIDTFVMGFVAREREDRAEDEAATGPEKTFFEDLMRDMYEVLTDGEHPRMTAFLSSMHPALLDMLARGANIAEIMSAHEASHADFPKDIFELGLECILDGIAARISAHGNSPDE